MIDSVGTAIVIEIDRRPGPYNNPHWVSDVAAKHMRAMLVPPSPFRFMRMFASLIRQLSLYGIPSPPSLASFFIQTSRNNSIPEPQQNARLCFDFTR